MTNHIIVAKQILVPIIILVFLVGCKNSVDHKTDNDITPPVVSYVTPDSIGINEPITVTFNEAMDPSTLNASTILVSDNVTGAITYDSDTYIAILTTSQYLSPKKEYTITITSDVKDLAGNAMTGYYISSFTTGSTTTTGNWEPMAGALSNSFYDTAVWTGTEAIDFGPSYIGRYNPQTDSWSDLSTTNMPPAVGRCTHRFGQVQR